MVSIRVDKILVGCAKEGFHETFEQTSQYRHGSLYRRIFRARFVSRLGFYTRPELYASCSAPWYAQLLVPGIVLVCVLLLGGAGKWGIYLYQKKKQ